jgi:hypothetical protein
VRQYHFETRFSVPATRDEVWAVMEDPTTWPSWWRWLRRVDRLDRGGPDLAGARYRYTFRTALPYSLTFDTETTRTRPGHLIEVRASGDLAGTGLWEVFDDDGTSLVRYTWIVATTKRWMNALTPVARRVFAWNHDRLMQDFATGFAAQLGTRPRVVQNRTVDPGDPAFGRLRAPPG